MAARKENGIYVVSDIFDVNRYDFGGTADQLKANIDLVVEKARGMGMVGEGRFDLELERGWYDDSDTINIKYYFTRVENDKERATREADEAKVKEEKAAKRKAAAEKKKLKSDVEYTEFLRLKEKFKEFEV